MDEPTDPAKRDKAFVYVMRANHKKLVDIALCLIHEAEGRGVAPTQFQLLKALFIADRAHLNRYRRPISYDRYRAMKHGPVAMTFYNMLMEDAEVLEKTGVVQWKRRRSADDKKYEFFAPFRPVDDERILSPSDIKALRKAMGDVIEHGNSRIHEMTHEDPAYLDAWEENDENRTFPMSIALFFDKPDHEEALQLSWLSRQTH